MKGIEARIPVNTKVDPIAQPYRRVQLAYEEGVAEQLEFLLNAGIIEKVINFSPWQSPIVPVVKKDGSIRICVDFRKVNDCVIRQPHPFPTFEELAAKFHGATIFSKLDIEKAFHQIMLSPQSRPLTTFTTHKGVYRYTRLPFGLCNAPELFQKVLEFVLEGLCGVMSYLDDVIVFGNDQEDHDNNLKHVLRKFDEVGIRLNVGKCDLGKRSLKFLGHEFSSEGVRPSRDKIDTLLKCKAPQNKEELQSFLGMYTDQLE